jgi:hypothetical protein
LISLGLGLCTSERWNIKQFCTWEPLFAPARPDIGDPPQLA